MTEHSREDLIADYEILHQKEATYGTGKPHPEHAALVRFLRETGSVRVLDFGCGKGGRIAGLERSGFDAVGYDPAIPEFASMPEGPFDAVISDDVFEHFHLYCVLDELLALKALGAKAHAFRICTIPARKTLPRLGGNLHTTLHSPMWWTHVLNAVFPDCKHRSSVTRSHVTVFIYR